jgi:polysaccharide export outer membrane protein
MINVQRIPAWLLVLTFTGLSSGASAQRGFEQVMQSRSASGENQLNAGTGTVTFSQVPEGFDRLKIAPGFVLTLSVLDDPDFSGTYRVEGGGEIVVPVLGAIHVSGETVAEARVQIREKLLQEGLLKDPQVTLAIREYTAPRVTILGEVAAPGKFPLLVSKPLVDVLLLAGGTTATAGDQITISHADESLPATTIHYSKSTNPRDVDGVMIEPGDTIQVKRAGVIYVLGSVNRPGGYAMQEEGKLTLLQAVSMAEGTSLTASIGRVYLIHHNENGAPERLEFAYRQILKGKIADVPLHPEDIVYVPASGIKLAFADTQQLMMAAASAVIYESVK